MQQCFWNGVTPKSHIWLDWLWFETEHFSLTDDIVPLIVISVGYPAAPVKAEEKHDAANIHLNGW
jgi:hypothetical protein